MADKPQIGQRVDISLQNQYWHGHPNPDIDIAVTPLVPILNTIGQEGKKVFFKSIPLSSIPTPDQINELDALENVVFVGYPNGQFDAINLLPIIRRGITASPIQVDYEGKPIFIVDASVFPGSSGSPVFIYDQGSYGNRGNITIGSRLLFIGVIAQVMIRSQINQIRLVPIPTQLQPIVETQQMIGLGIVFKASTVVEAVQDFLVVYQKNREASIERSNNQAQVDEEVPPLIEEKEEA